MFKLLDMDVAKYYFYISEAFSAKRLILLPHIFVSSSTKFTTYVSNNLCKVKSFEPIILCFQDTTFRPIRLCLWKLRFQQH